jgi:diguanylate cyclase (GGDEF)-like protein
MEARNSLTPYNPTEELSVQPWVEKISTFLTSANEVMRLSLGWVFELGISTEMPLHQKKNLSLINRVTFTSLLMAFPGTFLLMLMGIAHPFSLLISGVLVACIVLTLNGARQADWSTMLFAFSPAVFISFFSLLELGTVEQVNMLGLILSRQGLCFALLLPVLLYGYESQRKGLQVMGICVLVYLIYEVASMQLGAFGNENLSGITHGLFSVFSLFQYLALAGCVLYMQNYTRLQETQAGLVSQKMQRMAVHDGLTGLWNHTFMEQMIGDAINRSKRSRTPLSVLMIDVDYFKQVNDTYGHNTGDQVLKELISVLKTHKRSTDYLGRWGGDELVMLLTDTNLAGAANLAEKLRRLVEEHAFPRCKQLTISLGASEYQEGDSPLAIVERADAAMYQAKRGGRNRAESLVNSY